MRIVFLATDIARRSAGGIGTYVTVAAAALSRAGHEVTVLTANPGDQEPRGYQIVPIRPLHASHARRLRLAEEFAKIVRQMNMMRHIDVVEATDWGIEGWVCARDRVAPVIVRLHTPESVVRELNSGGRFLDSTSVVAVEGEYFRGAALSAPSRAIARLVCERYPDLPELPTVIPNPLPRIVCFEAGGEPNRAVFLGRLEQRKGVFTLAEALRRVFEAGTDLRVDFVGQDTRTTGGSVGRLLRDILAQWPERVNFHGYQEGEEKLRLIRAARFAVLPSLWENFPYAALEVLACGRPVVATRGSGFDEIIQDGVDGLLVPPDDPDELAAALRRAAQEPFRPPEELSARVGRFESGVVLPRMEQFYREVAARWNRR